MMTFGRRFFLTGAGVSLVMPAFESLTVERMAFGQPMSATPDPSIIFIFLPLGVFKQEWKPLQDVPNFGGATTELDLRDLPDSARDRFPRLSRAFFPSRRDLTFITRLRAPEKNEPGFHATEASSWLTGVKFSSYDSGNLRCGVSVDQLLKSKIRGHRFDHLYINATPPDSDPADFSPAAYVNNCSWESASQPCRTKIVDPKILWRKLTEALPSVPPVEGARDILVVDRVRESAQAVRSQLTSSYPHNVRVYGETLYIPDYNNSRMLISPL